MDRKEEMLWLRNLKGTKSDGDGRELINYLTKADYEAIGAFIQTIAELITRIHALGITREENIVELIKTYYRHNFGDFEDEDSCRWP